MDTQIVAAIVSGVATIIVAIVAKSDLLARHRSRIMRDVQLYNALPDTSFHKKKLLRHIDKQVKTFILLNEEYRRAPLGVAFDLFMIVLGAYLAWNVWSKPTWPTGGYIVAGPLLLFGLLGLTNDIPKRHRPKPIKINVETGERVD